MLPYDLNVGHCWVADRDIELEGAESSFDLLADFVEQMEWEGLFWEENNGHVQRIVEFRQELCLYVAWRFEINISRWWYYANCECNASVYVFIFTLVFGIDTI